MAASFLRTAEDELSCPVCFELFVDPNTPKTLPACGHVCCVVCLKKIAAGKCDKKCPECREIVSIPKDGVTSFLTNFRLRTLADNHRKIADGQSLSVAKPMDITCPCPDHKDEKMCLYCTTCNVLTCQLCMIQKHKGTVHNIDGVKEKYSQEKVELRSSIEEAGHDIRFAKDKIQELQTQVHVLGRVVVIPGQARELESIQTLDGFTLALNTACSADGLQLAVCESLGNQLIIYHKASNGQCEKSRILNLRSSNRTRPTDVAICSDGRFLVARGTCIEVYMPEGNLKDIITTAGKSGTTVNVYSVTTMSNDNILAGDIARSVITEHDPTGNIVGKIKTNILPIFITLIHDTHIAMSDWTISKVSVMDIQSGQETLSIDIPEVQGICYNEQTDCLLTVRSEPDSRNPGRIHPYTGVIEQYCCTTGRLVACMAKGLRSPYGIGFSSVGILAVADLLTVNLYKTCYHKQTDCLTVTNEPDSSNPGHVRPNTGVIEQHYGTTGRIAKGLDRDASDTDLIPNQQQEAPEEGTVISTRLKALQTPPKYVIHTRTKHIDNEGGEVNLEDLDMSIKIPQGALSATGVDISLTVDTNEPHPPFTDSQLVLGPVISCEPDGQNFHKPVTISVPHSGLNITKACLQVWCKTKSRSLEVSRWEMVFDGCDNKQNGDPQVAIDGNKIKIRVRHFSLYDFLTIPAEMVRNWLYPELHLDILAYMFPVTTITTSDTVLLRVYALKTNDVANKKLVKETENKDDESGMCTRPSSIPVRPNGNSLMVCAKHIVPEEKWIPVDDLIGYISHHNLQTGGVGARCEIKFRLNERREHTNKFEGAFDLKQDGNEKNTVKGIYFFDVMAKQDNAEARRVKQQEMIAQQGQLQDEVVVAAQCHQANQRPHYPGQHCDTQGKNGSPNSFHPRQTSSQQLHPQQLQLEQAGAACAAIDDISIKGTSVSFQGQFQQSSTDLQQTQLEQLGAACTALDDRSIRRATASSSKGHFHQKSSCEPRSGAIPRAHTTGKRDTKQKEIPLLTPCKLVVIEDSTATTTTSLAKSQSDWGPFLKRVARDIQPRWQEIAALLHFTPEECQTFISPNIMDWWAAYKMLVAWRLKLPKCEPEQLKNILADAIRPFDDTLARRIVVQTLQ